MKQQHTPSSRSLKWIGAAALLTVPAASQALDIQAGDWKFSFNGNVNVHYINTQCDDSTSEFVLGGLACNAGFVDTDGDGVPDSATDAKDGVSTVSNGLLPAAFVFGASTTQKGWDLAATLGLYPGVSTNDGGSPNLGADRSNTGLGTTGLDVRQVFMTFGRKDVGTFTLGRNFGLFGFDAIINDMTIPGVGASGAAANAAPSNTTLGSIGVGYIYTDTLAQMNYTTPDFGGFKVTLGIFDPVEPLLAGVTDPGTGADSRPGIHGKVTYTAGSLYLSSAFLSQKNSVDDLEGGPNTDFDTFAFDVGGKFTMGPLELMGWYYNGKGVGTTALLVLAADPTGDERDSDGFLAQATYKLGDTKFGLNYGQSKLKETDDDKVTLGGLLLKKNSHCTVGVYHALTPNLTLLAEVSTVESENHNSDKIESTNFNVGAFLAF